MGSSPIIHNTFIKFMNKNKKNNQNIDFLTSLLQLSIKKGKKSNSEKTFRDMLFHLVKNNRELNLNKFLIEVQNNIQPAIKLQKKKFNYKPVYATEWYKKNQASTWILNELKNNNKNFYKALASELLDITTNTSSSIKHRQTLYSTALQNTYIKTPTPKKN